MGRTNPSRVIKTYDEMILLPTYEERLKYLSTSGTVGYETFGSMRYAVERFYLSPEWKRLRNEVILRDKGCDLACPDRPIQDFYERTKKGERRKRSEIIIHHLVPLTAEDLLNRSEYLLDPRYLVTTTHWTHNLIHYGVRKDLASFSSTPTERTPNDTTPWKKGGTNS